MIWLCSAAVACRSCCEVPRTTFQSDRGRRSRRRRPRPAPAADRGASRAAAGRPAQRAARAGHRSAADGAADAARAGRRSGRSGAGRTCSVSLDRGAQPVPQLLRRLGRRQVGGHRGHDVGGLGDRAGAAGAVGQVPGEHRLVLGLERVQRPARRRARRSGSWSPRGDADRGSSGRPVDRRAVRARHRAAARAASSSFIRRMPASIRVFTVPRGAPVSAATSRWV